ncbi:MAG: AAA family ATPase, partial [Varibaculum cambriense]|nr:AAA family ATPase [Varibaculum cambriense]
DGKTIAFEAKSSAILDAEDVRHLNWLETRLGNRLLDKILVYTGPYAYRRKDGVAVIPLALLG